MAKIKLTPLKKPEEPKPTRPLPPFKLEYVVITVGFCLACCPRLAGAVGSTEQGGNKYVSGFRG